MKIVFLNRLERWSGAGEPERCQVYIGEDQGVWTAGCSPEPATPDDAVSGDIWYEGLSWEELLASFRHGVATVMRRGFRPVIDGMLEDLPFWERRPSLQTLIRCYAESRPEPEATEELKAWRRAKAAEEKRSAYFIATNRELHLLAVYVPHTPEELLQIPGFGKWKAEKYGNELLEILRKRGREHRFPLEWVAERVDPDMLADWLIAQREQKYSRIREAIAAKHRLLALIREGKTLKELESQLQCSPRELAERLEKLDEEGYDVLPLVERELSSLSEEELRRFEEAFAELGDRYLKPLYERIYGSGESVEDPVIQYSRLRLARIRFRRRQAAGAS